MNGSAQLRAVQVNGQRECHDDSDGDGEDQGGRSGHGGQRSGRELNEP